MPRIGMLLRVALTATLPIIVSLSASPVARAGEVTSPWSWTDYGPALRDVSCSAPGVCVAVGQEGMVLRSNPGGDAPLAWSRVPLIKYPDELTGVTCTKSFCLTVSNTRTSSATFVSKVFRSEDGGKTWSDGVSLPESGTTKTRSALAVACDPLRTCYAVGPGGGVWRTLDQGRSWEALPQLGVLGSYNRVACPAGQTCVAVGGDAAVSSAAIKGTNVRLVPLPPGVGKGMLALACDSATRCTATDGLGHYMSMSVPDKTWGPAKLFPKSAAVTDLACPIVDTCVGLAGPIALRTTSLGSPTGDWHRRPLGTLNLQRITCAHVDCVAVGKSATWFASFDAGFGWKRVNEVAKFDAIQCSAAFSPTCVAGGEKDVGVSRSGGDLWSLPLNGDLGLNVKAVNCTGTSECLFLGKGETLFTDDLEDFASRHPTITDPRGTNVLTCITKDLCIGVNEGVVYTTLDGAVTDWNHNAFPDKPTSVACLHGRTDPAVCVVTTLDFVLLGTMTQTDGRIKWNWRYTDADASQALAAVACSPGGECTAVGAGGEVLKSVGTDLMRWTELILPSPTAPVDTRPLLKSVTCPADGVCLAGGEQKPDAVIASTTDHWDKFSIQKFAGIEGAAPAVTSIGCETVYRCVGVGGTALVGLRHQSGARR